MSRPAYERGIEGVKRKSLDVWLQIVRCEQLTDVATFAMWLTQGCPFEKNAAGSRV